MLTGSSASPATTRSAAEAATTSSPAAGATTTSTAAPARSCSTGTAATTSSTATTHFRARRWTGGRGATCASSAPAPKFGTATSRPLSRLRRSPGQESLRPGDGRARGIVPSQERRGGAVMAHEVRGVVATAKKAPVMVETITVPDPGPGEALVRVKACGVCHTDLHYREGGINDDFPFLLGHEAAGVIAVVGDDRKLEWAKGFGATHTVNSTQTDPVEAIKELTDGNGADVVVEAVGRPETYRQAFFARDLAGTLVQVGVPNPTMTIELPMLELFGRGGALKSSWYGDCLPTRDFPVLIDLYLEGKLDLDGFVSETIGIDQVEEAFRKMERGEVLRSVVVL